jgi:hypothetical protein
LSAADAQAILNATPGQPGSVSWGKDNLLLNLAQQILAAELNVARGSTASTAQLNAIASANSAITEVKGSLGIIHISVASGTDESGLESTIENFNSANDCG